MENQSIIDQSKANPIGFQLVAPIKYWIQTALEGRPLSLNYFVTGIGCECLPIEQLKQNIFEFSCIYCTNLLKTVEESKQIQQKLYLIMQELVWQLEWKAVNIFETKNQFSSCLHATVSTSGGNIWHQ